jgi:hypothetical protein
LIEYDCYNNPDDNIQFGLALACYSYERDGIKILRAKPSDLKRDFENYYSDVFTNRPTPEIHKISGFVAVSLTASKPTVTSGTWFFHSSWIQIDTNVIVRVTVNGYNAKTFNSLTNSLKTIKINRQKILEQVARQFQVGVPLPIPRMPK